MKQKRNLRLRAGVLLAIMVAASTSSVVRAGDLFISETGLGPGQWTGSLVLPLGTGNYWAGLQTVAVKTALDDAAPTSFMAYCIDPAHYSTSAFTAFAAAVPLATAFATQASSVQRLFDQYYAGTLSNGSNAAAFQLALWEIANDDGSLASGSVRSNPFTNAGLLGNANTLLNAIHQSQYSGPSLYTLGVYKADRAVAGLSGQDYIVASAVSASSSGGVLLVPEPQTVTLLLAGLVLLAAAAPRRPRV